VRLTNERVGVFLARRSMQHLVSLAFKEIFVIFSVSSTRFLKTMQI
jgi:hypothetical protein